MSSRFFITGLPRSRTAWMSAFMSVGNSACEHEPRKWREWWADNGVKSHIGIADSGLGFQLPSILKEYAPRTLIIDRPPEEVQVSLDRLCIGVPRTNFVEILHKALEYVPASSLVMRVPYHMLNDLRTMQKCFWHLVPGEPFDEGRYREMCKQNIQADLDDAMSFPATHYEIIKHVKVAS